MVYAGHVPTHFMPEISRGIYLRILYRIANTRVQVDSANISHGVCVNLNHIFPTHKFLSSAVFLLVPTRKGSKICC